MNFKTYDILSSLIPGFLFLIVLFDVLNIKYDKDWIVIYTAEAFLLGYLVNAIGSWLEDFYFFTWSGKPSNRLLVGKGIWKVKFYAHEKAMCKLTEETSKNATLDELFNVAMRYAYGTKDTRVDDFNSIYAFSRSLLTAVLIGTIILLFMHYNDLRYYMVLIPILLICWIRCKQRGYYYSKEVLNVYLKQRS